MKKLTIIALAALCAVSCYPDYVGDYSKVGTGFANQVDVRSVVVGESMEFYTGVALGGVIDNKEDRKVRFTIDYSLVDNSILSAMTTHMFTYIQALAKQMSSVKPLPATAYELSTEGAPGVAVIKAGEHLGKIRVKLDKDFMLSDEGNLLPQYILPLRIESAEGCSVIAGRETTCIGVRFESLLFGSWWHGGETVVTDPAGEPIDTIAYHTSVPQAESAVWTLTSVGPYSLTANAVGGEMNGSAAQMKLTLGENGAVEVAAVPGAKYTVEPDGESAYNQAKLLQNRKVVLRYKYIKDGNTYHATDTLTFRNRIRDGVNEWQDENQNNY